ncbi:carboxymuconolactone decarboxylase family protein [Ferruginibacter albus]|uniref:carboxymuconolactone decarboxylase family protein n=1 Tax=Ferruginibacter albus TaxID=2875540 RepID=UPI001CC783A4|nr:carboxymuconolactone decarboxylase family protein [Ferruginibacter albus]UAY51850.1 carboxymuconolactone decarboxylase family protein [Ferruginibacter albus]
MEQRVNIEQTQPDAWKALYGLSGIVHRSSLTTIQKHLIMVRASQINSCAFCINMHRKDALKSGETQQRLFLLSAWRETDLFTEEEKAMLALTEEVTVISKKGVTDATYKQAEKFFSAETIGEIIMLVIVINAWNRIAVSTHKPIEN